jgi:general secretion pathway protein E
MNTGYKGRSGIYELLTMNTEVKKVVLAGSDSNKILEVAKNTGLSVLREYGMRKVIDGVTTLG